MDSELLDRWYSFSRGKPSKIGTLLYFIKRLPTGYDLPETTEPLDASNPSSGHISSDIRPMPRGKKKGGHYAFSVATTTKTNTLAQRLEI